MENYLEINRKAWNNRVDTHVNSSFYDMDSFLRGASSVPSLDRKLLGDIQQKSILHLQCHFGMDTLSLSREGAKVTGADFSEKAIAKAKELRDQLQVDADFICCDVYDLPEIAKEPFDMVYTSYGVVNWLPDLDKWGKTISALLKPGGKFVMVEFHPVLWMFDENFQHIMYAYSRTEPYTAEEPTYTEQGNGTADKTVTWNYGLSEPLNGLAKNRIRIEEVNEHYHSPFNLFGNMIELEKGRYHIKGLEDKIPVTYSIVATRAK
ncbi:bifunctional 2-polyprenyl-6-hydroxyphenol methylase/3-demethylubiquinol 3-O-methyltransferase UbiG [Proteiniphilum sp. X52]|uniref:class I SAM-dependent methyltransferase n=1 Tax=Proteiniphilum sp. X52 TaxID=2382159 RepID=UPI000F0A0016|nr:class I SAM-dependent methyltransferase [Proteiniphilum sp. X52]RNC65393.1 class I SAM-dependent methyltransferase [Proteiniphilum sp. X52]